jgi:hypothetical protein
MKNNFESKFEEIIKGMIASCKEYFSYGEKIYIYGINTDGLIWANFSFQINNEKVAKHKVDLVYNDVDVSIERQKLVNRKMLDYLEDTSKLCIKFEQPVPTVLKIIYDLSTDDYNIEKDFESPFGKDEEKTPDDCYREWMGGA